MPSKENETPSVLTETVQLGSLKVPRLFIGLWQTSSPAWGTASASKIRKHFQKHVDAGFNTFGAYTMNKLAEFWCISFGMAWPFLIFESQADKARWRVQIWQIIMAMLKSYSYETRI